MDDDQKSEGIKEKLLSSYHSDNERLVESSVLRVGEPVTTESLTKSDKDVKNETSVLNPANPLNRYSFLHRSVTDKKEKKNFWERTFSKMGPGGIRASIFNLMATAIGAGVLSLPYINVLAGLGSGIILTFIGAFIALWSLTILIHTSRKVDSTNYLTIAEKAGGKFPKILLYIGLLENQFGIIIIYQIFCGNIVQITLKEFGVENPDIVNELSIFEIFEKIAASLFICFPFCLMKDISSLRYVSMISIVTIGYTILVVLIEFPFYMNENLIHGEDTIVWFKFDADFFVACAMTFFAYTCQQSLFSVYREMERPIDRRVKKVIRRSLLSDFILYIIVASSGYLSTYSKTTKLVVDREPLSGHEMDYFMLFGRLGVYITLILSVPVNFFPLKRFAWDLMFGPTVEFTKKSNLIFTSVCLSITTIISIVFTKVETYFSFIGGIASVIMCYLVPTICYVKTNGYSLKDKRNFLSIILCCITVCVGITSVIMEIKELIEGNAS